MNDIEQNLKYMQRLLNEVQRWEKDLGIFSRGVSIEDMVEFLDLFFDATKIPFKMEFTRDDKEILYFYKNCNEH